MHEGINHEVPDSECFWVPLVSILVKQVPVSFTQCPASNVAKKFIYNIKFMKKKKFVLTR